MSMTPDEAQDYLSNHSDIEVVNADLNPEEDGMGRAQFLVTTTAPDAEVKEDLTGTGLELFNTDSSPDHFRHIALPPN